MARFAQLDSTNTVISIHIVNYTDEAEGIAHLQALFGLETVWRKTSSDGSFRKNAAEIGYTFDGDLDAFIAPQPNPSYILDPITCRWKAPPTKAEQDAAEKKSEAPENMKRVMELGNLTPSQAAEWLERQVHAGKRLSELSDEISNATSYSALKQPMTELATMLYQATEANKKILRLLTAVKDMSS